MKIPKAICTLAVILALVLTAGAARGQFFFEEDTLIGQQAPDFTLNTLKEKNVKFSALRGTDSAILFFWATWCPHCRDAIKDLTKKAQEMSSQGIRVVLVDLGETAREVQPYVTKKKIPFDVFLDTDSSLSDPYNLIGVPTFIFVGKDGVIKAIEHELPGNYEAVLSGRDQKGGL